MFGLWENLYLGLLLFGAGFLLIQLLLGNLGDAELDGELDTELEPALEGELDSPGGEHGANSGVSFLTPLIIAPALAGIGLVGLVATLALGLPLLIHLPLALVVGFGVGYALFFLLARVMAPLQGSSEVRVSELWGTVAEVITPIPAGRVGEVRFVARGSYVATPARSLTGESLARGQLVMIERIENSVALVRPTQ